MRPSDQITPHKRARLLKRGRLGEAPANITPGTSPSRQLAPSRPARRGLPLDTGRKSRSGGLRSHRRARENVCRFRAGAGGPALRPTISDPG
jgi:hypothetical protein